MEAGAGEITTLEDRLAQRVFYSNKHSQGYHTPSQTGGSTLHARGRCLPPTVLPSHAHGFISPLPAQRPARAPHGLPLRSDTPPPPAFTSPGPRRSRPSSLPRLIAESLRPQSPTGGRGAGAGAPPPHATTPGEGRDRTAHLARAAPPSLSASGAELGPPREPRAARRAGSPRRRGGGGGRDAGSRLLSPPPPRLPQPGRAPSHTRPLSHSLAVGLALPHPQSHTHSPPPHTHSHPAAPRSLTPALACSARACARPRSHTARATPAETAPRSPRPRRRAPPARVQRTLARPGPALRARRRGGQGAVAGGTRGRASPPSRA